MWEEAFNDESIISVCCFCGGLFHGNYTSSNNDNEERIHCAKMYASDLKVVLRKKNPLKCLSLQRLQKTCKDTFQFS